jgi:hypothetical protein
MFETLDHDSFVLFCAKCYDNPQCHDTEEFFDDIKRFKYLKRLFGKFAETGQLREQLILNHIVVLYNVFNANATRMLFFKLAEFETQLKPFLVLLNRMPNKFVGAKGNIIYSSSIAMDPAVIEILRKI